MPGELPRASRPGTVASGIGTWQSAAMPLPDAPSPTRSTAGGGVFIAFGAIGGTIVGLVLQQPVIGFLIGTALGSAAATLLWWRGR